MFMDYNKIRITKRSIEMFNENGIECLINDPTLNKSKKWEILINDAVILPVLHEILGDNAKDIDLNILENRDRIITAYLLKL